MMNALIKPLVQMANLDIKEDECIFQGEILEDVQFSSVLLAVAKKSTSEDSGAAVTQFPDCELTISKSFPYLGSTEKLLDEV